MRSNIGVIALSLTLALTTSCTRSKAPAPSDAEPQQAQGTQSAQAGGHPALQFDYKKTTELLISKSDPRTGDRWTARILREGMPSVENENLWTIQMGPDEITYGDRKANGTFILHLLDTARTLQVKEAPVSGTPESFGLNPPLFTLRWRVTEARSGTAPAGGIQARVFNEYEIRLGGPVKGENGAFEGLYVSLGGVAGKTFIAHGAMLQMLDKLVSFQNLRLPTLTTFSSDDVDEIEVHSADSKRAKRVFYAQREGERWTNAQHKPVSSDVGEFLDFVTHLRVLRFVDDAKEQSKLEPLIDHKMDQARARAASHTIIFKDRKGVATTLRVFTDPSAKEGPQVYATLSTRNRKTASAQDAPAIFEVYPEILQKLKQL